MQTENETTAENLLQVVKDNSFNKENAFTDCKMVDNRFVLWAFLSRNGFDALESDLDEIIAIVCDILIKETIKKPIRHATNRNKSIITNKDVSIICVMKQAAELLGGQIISEVKGYSVEVLINGDRIKFFNPHIRSKESGLCICFIRNGKHEPYLSNCEKVPPLFVLIEAASSPEDKQFWENWSSKENSEWTYRSISMYRKIDDKQLWLLKQLTPMTIDYTKFQKP